MSNPSLFGGNQLVSNDVFAKLQELTKNVNRSSGGGGIPRISLKGGKFRKIVNGQQMDVSRDATMNIIVVGVAPLMRTYYAGAYNPENPTPPACWSTDTKRGIPSEDVSDETRQSTSCDSCPQNVKGSGQGQSRACRYGLRLAVLIEGDFRTVYQLNLSSLSVFGNGEGHHQPFLKYQDFLADNDAPIYGIVTEMAFDENADVPKVYFKPVRPLEAEEAEKLGKLDTNAVERAVKFTVSQADGVQAIPAAQIPVKQVEVEDDGTDEIPFEEPKKVASKSKAKEAPVAKDFSAIVDAWDD